MRTLKGVVQLHLKIRRCPEPQCELFRLPYRPEGQWALPQHELGLDVIALVGALRHQEYRSVAEHRHLQQYQVTVSERTVSNLLAR